MSGDSLLDRLHHRLMVSCQAYPGDPLNDPMIMAAMARSVVAGGAAAVRAQGLAELAAVRAAVDVPLVGLEKLGSEGVFITPTVASALRVAATGCEIVAVDGTQRVRPDGRTLGDTVSALRERAPHVLIMADCATAPEATAAERAGVDLIGTTLAGYTEHRPRTEGPDFAVLEQMCGQISIPVIAEGRYHHPDEVARAFAIGAFSVCVGNAITHPTRTTERFAAAAPHAQ